MHTNYPLKKFPNDKELLAKAVELREELLKDWQKNEFLTYYGVVREDGATARGGAHCFGAMIYGFPGFLKNIPYYVTYTQGNYHLLSQRDDYRIMYPASPEENKQFIKWLVRNSVWADAFHSKYPKKIFENGAIFNTHLPFRFIHQAATMLRHVSDASRAVKTWITLQKLYPEIDSHIAWVYALYFPEGPVHCNLVDAYKEIFNKHFCFPAGLQSTNIFSINWLTWEAMIRLVQRDFSLFAFAGPAMYEKAYEFSGVGNLWGGTKADAWQGPPRDSLCTPLAMSVFANWLPQNKNNIVQIKEKGGYIYRYHIIPKEQVYENFPKFAQLVMEKGEEFMVKSKGNIKDAA